MLTVVAAAFGAVYLYTQLDDEIRLHAEKLLDDHYQDLDVRVGGARLIEGSGIRLHDVTFADPRVSGVGQTLVTIDEIFLKADVRIAQLVQNKLQVDQIIVRRPQCRAIRHADGKWNLAKLLPAPKFGDGPLNLRMEGGQLEIVTSSDVGEPLALRDFQCVAKRPAENSVAGGVPSPIHLEIEFSSQSVERMALAGTIDSSTGDFAFDGQVDDLHVASQLCRHIPRDLFPVGSDLNCVQGTIGFAFRVARHAADGNRVLFSLDAGTLSDGSVDHPRLSRLVTKVAGKWTCDNQGFEVQELTGRFGEGTFSANCRRRGWQSGTPVEVDLRVTHLAVDQRFIEALPSPMNGLWRKFEPEGLVDVDEMRLEFDGRKWRQEKVVITCQDLAFRPEKFPYRVTKGRGTIRLGLTPDRQSSESMADLVFDAGGREARFRSHLTNPGPKWVGWMHVDGEGIQIDDALIQAIPNDKKGRDFVESLNPVGRIDVAWQARRNTPSQEKLDIEMDLRLQNCSVVYERFIYPLHNIVGQVHLEDGRWDLTDLQGVHSAGTVQCAGSRIPTLDGGTLELTFDCQNIALAEDLQGALPPPVQNLWSQLRPRGQADARISVRHETGQPKPTIEVTAWPRGDSVSVYPTFFPYRFEKIEGEVLITEGNATLRAVRATKRTKTHAGGRHMPIRFIRRLATRTQPVGSRSTEG